MDCTIKCLDPGRGDYYRFQSWFYDAWCRAGGEGLADVTWPHKVRALLGRKIGFSLWEHQRKLIVCGCHRIESCVWPWNYFYEIIPFMWDLWPDNYEDFRRFVVRNRVKIVFCSSSQSTEWVRLNCPDVRAVWIPEAIDVASFPMGPSLSKRSIDVLCYGRKVPAMEAALHNLSRKYRCETNAGRTFDDLTKTLRDSKISICYPLCDTNPAKAQGVETLTQRYWEGMLSGNLMVGRAPKELIDFCGYDPVVTLGDDPLRQLGDILEHIDDYQELVDRNRKFAEGHADWTTRIPLVLKGLRG